MSIPISFLVYNLDKPPPHPFDTLPLPPSFHPHTVLIHYRPPVLMVVPFLRSLCKELLRFFE
jgi:hypothetical protein